MFFNPLFLQSGSDAGAQTSSASNKLGNAKYLFSDIIKVFNESDPTAPGAVLPESTTVSSTPEIFSFQPSDISAKVNFEIPKIAEETQDQNILELLSSILLANASPVESLKKISESMDLSEANPEVKPVCLSGTKEFVVQSEILPQLLTQLLTASHIADPVSTKTVNTVDSLPSKKNNLEILISGLMKKLETDGEATIQLENAGKNIQFKISKIDETENGNSDTPAATAVQPPTTASITDVVNPINNVIASADKPDQSSLKEVVKEIPNETGIMIETGKQNISSNVVSNSSANKLNHEGIKNTPTNSVIQSRNIDLELDKLISQAIKSGKDVTVDNVPTEQPDSKLNNLNSITIGEQTEVTLELKSTETKIPASATEVQTNKTEVQTNKTEMQSNKIEVQLNKTEVQPNKTEVQLNKTEVQPNKIEVQPNKIEVQPGKTELQSSETKVQPNKTEVQPNKIEVQPDKNKVQSGKVEVQTDKNYGKLNQSEAKPSETTQTSVKNYLKADSQNLPAESEHVEIDTQINKVLNSQLNLNSERVIHALEVEAGAVAAPKILNGYKIVMEVGEEEAKPSTFEKNVDVVNTKPSPIISNAVPTDVEKNLTSDKPANTYSVKTILDSIKQVLKNESAANSVNGFENKKINVTTDQNKVETSDLNLLDRLAQTNSKLISVSKAEADVKPVADLLVKSSTTPQKHFVEEKNQTTLDKNESSFANELIGKTDENTFVKSTPTAEVGKEISSLKFAGNADQKVISEIKQTEPQVQNHPVQIDSKQETKVLNEAPVLNEPLIVKSKTESDAKKNSPEIQKVSVKSESEKPVVKTLLTDKETGADIHQHQSAQTGFKDVKHETAKTSPEVEETKPADVQNNVSTNHQANELKNSLPKEKISTSNFQLPETEKTIKSFELSKEISEIIESGTSQKVVLRLLPEALGKVKLTLEVGGEVIHAKAEVENESVKQIIQTNTETLKQTLSQNGLQLASFNVSLAGSDEKHQKAHGQKKRSNTFTSKSKIEKQVLPEATRTLGYNTYEYLA